jgi:hypothetical protein
MMTSHQAKVLAGKGWTKAAIRKYVYEYGRVPAYRHSITHEGGGWTIKKLEALPPGPMDPVAIVPSPEHIRVLVGGGPGAFMGIAVGAGLVGAQFVTKKIQLPAAWPKLVAKYKSFVPAYEKY